MEFELFQELLLTAVIPILFAFLIDVSLEGGHGEGERSEDTRASSFLPNSLELLWRQLLEEFQNADGFGTGEQLRSSEREIAAAEVRDGGIDLVLEIFEEKRRLADEVGEKIEEISEEIPEQDVIERYNVEDLKEEKEEEEKDEEEEEAESSSSDMNIVPVQRTEIGSRRDEEVISEINGGSLLYGEFDWEGIEITELQKRFRLMTEYSSSPPGSGALACLTSDVQLELYGLYKIATEGPCYRSHPLSLKSSTRARWHAWKKLGRMAPEIAMEQYISLLSKSIPGWLLENSGKGILDTRHPDTGSSLQNQLSPSVQMKLGDQNLDEVNSATGGFEVLDQDVLWGKASRRKLVNLLDQWRMRTLELYSV